MNLTSIFKRTLIGASILASVGSTFPHAIHSSAPVSLPRPGEICISPGQIRNPQSPVAHYISGLYRAAAGGLEGNLYKVCVNPDLWAQAQAFPNEGTVRIRPEENYEHDPETILTMRHELRHMEPEQHKLLNLTNSLGNRTIPERQRAAMAIFIEVDAFVSEVAFAHDMGQKGHPEYIQNIRNCPDCPTAHMLERYEQTLPQGVSAAMQQAFLEFFRWKGPEGKTPSTRTLYLEKIAVSPYHQANWNPNPSAPAYDLLSDENLHFLGQRNGYNYMMDSEFKTILRTEIFSEKYYAELVRWFDEGSHGPAP